ncbi:MAG: hypothetical protein Tsb0027_26040 [Wenzhouxiangellaceae bacterium]
MAIRMMVIILMFAILNTAHAQSGTLAAVNSEATAPSGGIPGPADVLWDNTAINNTTAGIISSGFTALPAGADRTNTADDFVVPAGELWSIEFVYSEGFTNTATTVDRFEVVFYEDAAGQPGAVISSQTVPFGGPVTMTLQELTLPAAVALGEGTYWISVIGQYDGAADLAVNRWNWSTGPTGIGSEWFLQDTAGFFGGLPWTSASGLGIADISTLFALRGTSQAAGPVLPPPPAVPTMNSFGLLGMALALMLAAGLFLRRRA